MVEVVFRTIIIAITVIGGIGGLAALVAMAKASSY